MKIPYNEKILAIDLITDNYKNLNPFEIINKAKDELDVNLKISDVLDYLQVTEDFEKASINIEMGYNMNEYE